MDIIHGRLGLTWLSFLEGTGFSGVSVGTFVPVTLVNLRYFTCPVSLWTGQYLYFYISTENKLGIYLRRVVSSGVSNYTFVLETR